MCDQISDAVLDAHLKLDPDSKVIDGSICLSKYPIQGDAQPTQRNVFLTKLLHRIWG